jgi:hypothetical protein
MKSLKILTVIFIVASPFSIPTFAQEVQSSDFRNNSLYGSIGFGGLIATYTINYERIMTSNLDRGVVATFIKTGFGGFASWGDDGKFLNFQYGILTGSKAGHLELSAGPNFILKGDWSLPVAATLGYRLQRPGKGFMFRTGLALPESLYIGLGFSF